MNENRDGMLMYHLFRSRMRSVGPFENSRAVGTGMPLCSHAVTGHGRKPLCVPPRTDSPEKQTPPEAYLG